MGGKARAHRAGPVHRRSPVLNLHPEPEITVNTFDAIIAMIDAEIAVESTREKEAREMKLADGRTDPVGVRVGDFHAARIYGMNTVNHMVRRQQAAEVIAR